LKWSFKDFHVRLVEIKSSLQGEGKVRTKPERPQSIGSFQRQLDVQCVQGKDKEQKKKKKKTLKSESGAIL
jgi:hypothetical protein